MKRFFLVSFLILIAVIDSHAQIDTEFWFVAPEITSGHGDRPIYLRISTQDKPANIIITQPANANLQLANLNILSNTTQTIDLTGSIDLVETSKPGTVMKTGIKIVSSAPITAYYEEGSPWNSEIFALKGKNALGNRFIIAGQNLYDNSQQYNPTPYSSFDVVATQNNTVITVRPTRPIFGHVKDSEIIVRLNAGETYSFRKMTTLASDNPIGTVVESSKPIAITIKDDSVINNGCRDILGDQIVPVKVAGVEYVVIKGFLSTTEYIFITATENNTKVSIGGVSQPQVTLRAGELYRYPITDKATYVVATKTIYVFHVTGFGCELGMALLPSINCKGSQQIGFTRSTSEFFGLDILIKKDGIGNFKLNNSAGLIPLSAFTSVPGTGDNWYTAQLSFTTFEVPVGQASLIANDKQSFQVGMINGNPMTTCRYGYFSAFSTLFLGDDFKICDGESTTIDAGGGKDSYAWNTGATTQKINVAVSGRYWVTAVKDECILHDTVTVKVEKGKEDLGPDVMICMNDTARVDGKNNFSWKWSDGSTNQFLVTKVPGKYTVSVSDYTGCPASDTIVISWYKRLEIDNSHINLNYVSVDTLLKTNINLSWTASFSDPKRKGSVLIYKRMLDEEVWSQQSKSPLTESLFKDQRNLTANTIYEYYVSLSDQCFGEVVSSNLHNSMLLHVRADTITDIISLRWNPYIGWKYGVKNYEVWRKLDQAPGYKLLAVISGNDNVYSAVVASDGFMHDYVIRALENNGVGESWSNNVLLELQHPVYIPNVFTPNSDEYNQYFEIKKIQLYRKSELVIMNRWGKKVFSARGYTNNWDGEELDTGVYYYVLDLKRRNKIMKGTVSILK